MCLGTATAYDDDEGEDNLDDEDEVDANDPATMRLLMMRRRRTIILKSMMNMIRINVGIVWEWQG